MGRVSVIVSIHAERALLRLGELQAFVVQVPQEEDRAGARLISATPDAGGRLSASSGAASLSSQRTLSEMSLVRITSVVDAYVTDLTRHEVNGRIAATASDDPLLTHLTNEQLDRSLGKGSWLAPLALWKEGMGVKAPSEFAQWSALDFLRITRNHIVHGFGDLPDDAWVTKARSLGRVTIEEAAQISHVAQIPVSLADVRQAAALSREFILWLDARRSIV